MQHAWNSPIVKYISILLIVIIDIGLFKSNTSWRIFADLILLSILLIYLIVYLKYRLMVDESFQKCKSEFKRHDKRGTTWVKWLMAQDIYRKSKDTINIFKLSKATKELDRLYIVIW